MRVALLTARCRAGDAIGNQVAEKVAFFLERGADLRVFVESEQHLHPAVRPHGKVLRGPEPRGEDWDFLASADLIVIEYSQYDPFLEWLPLLAGKKTRIVFDYHGITPPQLWGSQGREVLERGTQQRGLVWCADAAISHSQFTRQELLDHTHYPVQQVFQLGHAIDAQYYRPGAPATDLRETLGLGPSRILLFVGRLAPNKRVDLLVEALHHLRDIQPALHAVLVGDASDLYQGEARRCSRRAAQLGIADRLHVLGQVADGRLRDAYRSADVFVMPSLHEGFCIPVIEAMACGVPVVAARASALPETVASGGLTFTPNDAGDLARQLRRLLTDGNGRPGKAEGSSPGLPRAPLRVALVAFRYGTDFVGGAETSLRSIASALRRAGHHVEVFTTCTNAETGWSNQFAEGTVELEGIPVHRFALDAHDPTRHGDLQQVIEQAGGIVPDQVEGEYLAHSLHSSRLLGALRERADQFDAVITGPYLFGLTVDIAHVFPEKTLLLPCFHDEPLARLRVFRTAFENVGGILYHSLEEQVFAEATLGLNHPGAVYLGTLLETDRTASPDVGRAKVGAGRPYLVYCGRRSREKEFVTLLEWAGRSAEVQPDRFTFAFLGGGEVSVPRAPWARDLGFVNEADKQALLAGAAAVVQLSRRESLSLVALEAWAQGTPVIADGRCPVLAGHLRRGNGGMAVESFEGFAKALDGLWENPKRWQEMGRQGQQYVRSEYGSRDRFTHRLEEAIRDLRRPLAERMRRRGMQRAAAFDRPVWREQFGRVMEEVLHAPARPFQEQVNVLPRSHARTVAVGTDSLLVPVRVLNGGTHAVAAEGPARWVLRTAVTDEAGGVVEGTRTETPLPGLLIPGQPLTAAVSIAVPGLPGEYRVKFRAERAGEPVGGAGLLPAGAPGRQEGLPHYYPGKKDHHDTNPKRQRGPR